MLRTKLNVKNKVIAINILAIAVVIYEALCFDVAQGRMNGVTNETWIHSCRFASLAC